MWTDCRHTRINRNIRQYGHEFFFSHERITFTGCTKALLSGRFLKRSHEKLLLGSNCRMVRRNKYLITPQYLLAPFPHTTLCVDRIIRQANLDTTLTPVVGSWCILRMGIIRRKCLIRYDSEHRVVFQNASKRLLYSDAKKDVLRRRTWSIGGQASWIECQQVPH